MRALPKILGLKAWKALAEPRMHFVLFAVLYLSVVEGMLSYASLWKAIVITAFMTLYLSYGVLLNDYIDMPYDKLSGKDLAIYHVLTYQVVGLILLLSSLSFIIAILYTGYLFILIYIATFCLATFYSAPPVRFKKRGIMSLIVDALIEQEEAYEHRLLVMV